MKFRAYAVSFVLSAMLSILCHYVWGQADPSSIPKIEDLVKIPPSPEAAAFAKYGNTPVNLYTGTPTISIPIASVRGRTIEVPISLNYDASGIKVEQLATWAGLGWNLNAGGMVTRQVNGLPDDYLTSLPSYFPFYHTSISADYEFAKGFTPTENSIYPQGQLQQYFAFMRKVTRQDTNEKYDIQPDTYSFNALGISGTIFINYSNATAYCIESPELKITPIFFPQLGIQQLAGWEIMDAGGNKYFFNQSETTHVYDNDPNDSYRTYNSAWALTKVITTNNRDTVNFNYTTLPVWEQEQLAGRGDVYEDFNLNSICGLDQMIVSVAPTYKISQLELTSIYINGKVAAQIDATLSRTDLVGKHALTRIAVVGSDGVTTQQVQFHHSYFGSGTNEKELRLRLDSVRFFGKTLVNPQVYKFYYYDGLPSRESKAQDYWGYYNGANTANTLIPYNYSLDKDNQSFQGAKRIPNFSFATAGTMYKIKYPTGGTTDFTYQPHKLPSDLTFYEEEYTIGSTALTGAPDPLDPFNYRICDDMTAVAPKGVETSFQVTQSGTYRLQLYLTNSNPGANPANHMYFIAMYSAGAQNQPRTFCDLLNGGNTLYSIYQNTTPGFSVSQNLTLTPGYYRIMILNNNPYLNIQAYVYGIRSITSATVQGVGLRIQKTEDKNEFGSIVSKRCYYYGNLSAVPSQNRTESWIAALANAAAGSMHTSFNFETVNIFDKQEESQPSFMECGSIRRSGSNSSQSHYFITYPVVSSISFDSQGNQNGFEVIEFQNTPESWNAGFSRKYPNNGKQISSTTYSRDGNKLTRQRQYYSQTTVVPGTIGFTFLSTRSTQKDLVIKSGVATPTQELYTLEYGRFLLNGSSWSLQHCSADGVTCFQFSDTNYHSPHTNHIGFSCPNTFNPSHPARISYNQLISSGAVNPTITHANTSGIVSVCQKSYNIIYCNHFGSEYQKVQSLYSRYWPRLDSTVSIQYNGPDSMVSYTRNLYDNMNHYQITRVRQRDSRGDVVVIKLSYAHEMNQANPAEPIWTSLISQHRLSEVIRTEKFNQNGANLLATENTIYRWVGSMLLPDKKQYATGNNLLEDRIRFVAYDGVGNITQLCRANDVNVTIVYGYNNSLPILQATNAGVAQLFYTSFEEGPYDFTNDAKTGVRSKNGFNKILTGLTAGNYSLEYWQKVAGNWNLVSNQVNVTGSTYTINLSGQIDEVRFYPASAQVSSFAYQPNVGRTVVNDFNSLTTRYEYDDFGRLRTIRDKNENILSLIEYHYIK